MNEFDFIDRYLRPLATHPGALGLRDDAALLSIPPGKELVITQDAISSGIHFIGNEPPAQIARKLLRVNLSDLAAKGATPLGYFLSLMLSANTPESWFADFTSGLAQDQSEFKLSLLGGDTSAVTGAPSLSLTALGLIDQGKMLKRSGAKAGDTIYVSGTLGDAAFGLEVARGTRTNAFLLNRYQIPQPRLALGQALIGTATACMDISDGLMQDLSHLCRESGIGATLHAEQIPLSDATKTLSTEPRFLETVATGGDDYELLFTSPQKALSQIGNTQVTTIGICTSEPAINLLQRNTPVAFSRAGYRHFE